LQGRIEYELITKRAIFFIALLIAACTPAGDALAARRTLIEFFDHLANDEYEQAVDLYGGDYQQLLIFNPDIDPANKSELWRLGCRFGGLQCLPIASAALRWQSGDTLTFAVEFRNLDGSLFILGPCCGSTATEMPPRSQFEIRVRRTPQGTHVVMDLPVYVP
jgi:hypothetical protein